MKDVKNLICTHCLFLFLLNKGANNDIEMADAPNISFDSMDVGNRYAELIQDLKNISLEEALERVQTSQGDNLWEAIKDDIKKFLRDGCKEACQYYATANRLKKMEFETKEATKMLNVIKKLLDLGHGNQLIDLASSFFTDEETLLHYEPMLLVIAVCSTFGDENLRKRSFNEMTRVCFNSPRLFFFVAICDNLMRAKDDEAINTSKRTKKKGKNVQWDKMRKKAIAGFYLNGKSPLHVLFDTTRWNRRYNVTHRSVLGKCRPKPSGPNKLSYDLIFCYLTRGFNRTAKKFNKIEGIFFNYFFQFFFLIRHTFTKNLKSLTFYLFRKISFFSIQYSFIR